MLQSNESKCRLCLNQCPYPQNLYDATGQANEVYVLARKYFSTKLLNSVWGKHLKNICMDCWSRMYEFHAYQQSVLVAQWKLSEAYQSSIPPLYKSKANGSETIDLTEESPKKNSVNIPRNSRIEAQLPNNIDQRNINSMQISSISNTNERRSNQHNHQSEVSQTVPNSTTTQTCAGKLTPSSQTLHTVAATSQTCAGKLTPSSQTLNTVAAINIDTSPSSQDQSSNTPNKRARLMELSNEQDSLNTNISQDQTSTPSAKRPKLNESCIEQDIIGKNKDISVNLQTSSSSSNTPFPNKIFEPQQQQKESNLSKDSTLQISNIKSISASQVVKKEEDNSCDEMDEFDEPVGIFNGGDF
ncbi:uncharacterized protein LOC142230434 [Haematobia irritans]|uniref:uncharacterized protein LOC142230434 n=1 Tax=Haematobia irritans TaxID=7368 RepID=UPI003F4FD5BC